MFCYQKYAVEGWIISTNANPCQICWAVHFYKFILWCVEINPFVILQPCEILLLDQKINIGRLVNSSSKVAIFQTKSTFKPMKHFLQSVALSALCLLVINMNISGQTCTYDNMYDNPAPWTFVNEGENIPDNPSHPGPGQSLIADNRLKMVDWNGGGHDLRVYRGIPALSDSWMVEFDIRITEGNPFFTPGAFHHPLFALTAGNQIPLINFAFPFDPDNVEIVSSEQDGVVLELISVGTITSVHVTINDDGMITDACSIVLPLDLAASLPRAAKVRLENFGNGFGQLTIDGFFGNWTDSCCFEISSSIQNLTHIQHSTNPTADYEMYLAGGFEDLCINDGSTLNSPCNAIVSVESEASVDNFSMDAFPNPVSDLLTIRIAAPGVGVSDWNMHIFDISGRLLMQKSFLNSHGSHQTIDTSKLSPGSYALMVQSADGRFQAQQILVKY